MAKKHSKAVDNFNEELLRYIMDSVYYTGEGEGDDEDAGVAPMDYAPLLADAKSYREGRNRLIKKIQDDGNIDFLLPAIEAYNYDYGNPEAGINYTPESFDVSKLKKEPINIPEMSLQDVDAATSAIADFLGYSDNGDKERGKLEALLKQYYAKDKGTIANLIDAHAGDYSFLNEPKALSEALREKVAENPSEKARLYRMLGITPDTDLEEVLNIDKGLPAYATRSYRAYTRKKDAPAKAASFVEGVIASPQMAEKWDSGRTPTANDVLFDVGEGAVLAPFKWAKFVPKPIRDALGLSALDLAHDAIEAKMNEKVYSQGEYPDAGSDYSGLADPSRLYGVGIGTILGGRGMLGKRAENALERFGKKSSEKVAKLEKKASNTAKETAEGVAEIEKRRQGVVRQMEDATTALQKLEKAESKPWPRPMPSKNAGAKKEKLEGVLEEGRGILAEADIDQAELEKRAEKVMKETARKIKAERAKKAAVDVFGNIAVGRALYNDYSRKNAGRSAQNAWNAVFGAN